MNHHEIIHHEELGFHLLYAAYMDSGGIGYSELVRHAITQTGAKKHYNHAHEWCCGHGAMGFNLLYKNFCDQVTLTDINPDCIRCCEFTSAVNNQKDQVNLFQIENLSDIPIPSQPWDLIVTNPPYVGDRHYYESNGKKLPPIVLTKWVDQDWKAHENFFENLKKYITNNCDIYMFGIPDCSRDQIDIANKNGFRLIGNYDYLSIDLNPSNMQIELLHFRPL
jgi:methylase of polypeptide subunit release factors